VSNYRRVLDLEPQNYKAHNNLGSIYLASNDLVLAEHEYLLAIELNPSLFSLYYNLASVYIKSNDRDRALAALDKALELNPNFTQAKQRRELLPKGDVSAEPAK
jgi:tetratricopeptide (TPR) repeat protein